MSYQQIKLTEQGKGLIQRTVEEGSRIEFSEIRLSSQAYRQEELEELASLDNVHLISGLRESKRVSDNTIQLRSNFSNEGISGGFTVNTVGVYAFNPDYVEPMEPDEDDDGVKVQTPEEEQEQTDVEGGDGETGEEQEVEEIVHEKHILYGVATVNENPFYMSVSNPTTLNLNLTVGVGEAETVNLTVDPAGVLYGGDLDSVRDEISGLSSVVKGQNDDMARTLALQSAESLELAVDMAMQQNIEAAQSQAELIEAIIMMGGM